MRRLREGPKKDDGALCAARLISTRALRPKRLFRQSRGKPQIFDDKYSRP